jgi:DNA-binding HxlR family transcriptional regulator
MPMIRTGENAYRILLALSEGDKRFNELLREVKKASLAKELTLLEKMKYIKRNVIDAKPPQTNYGITTLGRDFLRSEADKHFPRLEVELRRLKQVAPDKIKVLRGNI